MNKKYNVIATIKLETQLSNFECESKDEARKAILLQMYEWIKNMRYGDIIHETEITIEENKEEQE